MMNLSTDKKQAKIISLIISLLGGILFLPFPSVAESPQWKPMTTEQENQTWRMILNSPLGIAALNQLAIEGFISPQCLKSLSIDETGFQSRLRVECFSPRGVSIAVSYSVMDVIFSRHEDNIENFRIERILSEK